MFLPEFGERMLRTGSEMGDDLGSGEGTHPARLGEGATGGPPREETGGVEITGTGGVHRGGGDRWDGDALTVGGEDDRTMLGTGQAGHRHMPDDVGDGDVELRGLVQRADLGFVGEEDVDIAGDQVEELGSMAIHAEAVGEGEGHPRARRMRSTDGGADDVLGAGIVPEIALDVEHLRRCDERRIDVDGSQRGGDAEIGVHGALRVWGDEDETTGRAGGGFGTSERLDVERHPCGPDVMGEDRTEFVVGDLPDEGHRSTERGDPGGGVGGRTARDLDGRRHVGVDAERPLGVDEFHRPLDHGVSVEEGILRMGEHVDDGHPDAHDVDGSPFRGCEQVHRIRPYAGEVTARELPSDSPAFDDPEVVDPYRLPTGVRPTHYRLVLEPDLVAATFTGTVGIDLIVEEPTTAVCCNALDLTITSAHLVDAAGATIEVAEISLDPDTERATFTLPTAIDGEVTLHVAFAGELNDKLRGFYRSTFTDADGVEQIIATTQFEATDARRAFPCWDEPALKASYSITLVVDADLFAVSNAAELDRSPHPDRPDRHIVRFADTMVMSTYLVAFIVGPLEATDPVDVDGTPLRIVYPRGKGHLTAHALDVGAFCLRHFTDYYGIAYPGDKLDLVAVPDFAFGAMENLGCVTFREILLLVDPDNTTQAELLNVTDVINHELAHMWFGDLVTMKWWNGIWLNEAFATFMEMHATDAYRPEWERWVTFGLARTAAFDTDALTSTRPIEYPVISPADAEGMFDILTYEKGAAVVRMLEAYLEPEVFRAGIRSYLAEHAYGNTETTDLWDAIEATSGQPVRSIMDSWIMQGGHPLISVDLVNDGRTLRLSQHRFGYAGDLGEGTGPAAAHDDTAEWIVPIIISQRTMPDGVITFEKVLLDQRSMDIDLVEPALWVLANTEGTGFYRVNHAPQLLAALVAHAQTDLSPIERYGLIDDAWAGVLAGRTSAHEFMHTIEAFAGETDLSVWQRIIAALTALDRLLEDDARSAFETRVRALLAPCVTRLGDGPVDGESDRDRALRGVLFEALGVLGNDPAAAERARVILGLSADAAAGSDLAESADAAMRAAAVAIVAATGTPAEFDVFVERMATATTPQDEVRYLTALADFPDADSMRRLLALSITDAVRTQNAPMVLRRALTNRTNGELAWFFISAEWDTINARFPSNSIARMLEGIRSLSRPSMASEILVFFETHEVPQGDRILAQHLERLEVSVALRRREAERLSAELLEHHRFLHRH